MKGLVIFVDHLKANIMKNIIVHFFNISFVFLRSNHKKSSEFPVIDFTIQGQVNYPTFYN